MLKTQFDLNVFIQFLEPYFSEGSNRKIKIIMQNKMFPNLDCIGRLQL